MANLHAAIGIQQLSRLDEIRRSRVNACEYYSAELSKISEVRVPQSDFKDMSPFLYYIRVPAKYRDALREYMAERGVDTGKL
jgi:dTDP-4-amino-4,6-dideoxygalactose transaminase